VPDKIQPKEGNKIMADIFTLRTQYIGNVLFSCHLFPYPRLSTECKLNAIYAWDWQGAEL